MRSPSVWDRVSKFVVCVPVLAGLAACGETKDSGKDDSGDAGSGGSRGSDSGPVDSKYAANRLETDVADKVDLLFMIDNSISMADKQAVLKDAIPDLVRRLLSPNCVDLAGIAGTTPEDPNQACGAGLSREFVPIKDIHVGIITSSLGGHGAQECKGADGVSIRSEQEDDHGYLIAKRPRFAAALATATGTTQPPEPAGFLNWNPAQNSGSQSVASFNTTFQTMVTAAGEFGCGYESQLEAMYRFLSDPEPYKSVEIHKCPGTEQDCAYPTGIDDELLSQRKAFLRPDSIVVAALVSDENDCSIQDRQQSYYAARGDIFLPASRAICATNPNDPCCVACISLAPPQCEPDPACTSNKGLLPRELDQANLRCVQQKQRFGFDFLYPTKRYVNALTQPRLCTSNADLEVNPVDPEACKDGNGDNLPDIYPNPLFTDLSLSGAAPRSASRVFFAGIVGVPWQDLKTDKNEQGEAYPPAELHFASAQQLETDGVWDKFLGNPHPSGNAAPILPTNSLMIESVQPRSGTDGQGAPLAPPGAATLANPVNGHEWGNTAQDDLQYACMFPLPTPRDCVAVKLLPDPQPGCDCKTVVPGDSNPLCQNSMGSYGTTQYFAKAYPGLRELEVLKGIGQNAIVSSICARNLKKQSAQDYGYRPAMDAIVDRVRTQFQDKCLPYLIHRDERGDVPCHVVEVRPGGSFCDPSRGRVKAAEDLVLASSNELQTKGVCGVVDAPACDTFVYCSLDEAGPECHHVADQVQAGWCYLDAQQHGDDDPPLFKNCGQGFERLIRFVDPSGRTPEPDAQVILVCDRDAVR